MNPISRDPVRFPLGLLVERAELLADRVLGLTLVDPNHGPLPAWEPGAHIDVKLPSGVTRSYSLCGDPSQAEYHMAVLREEKGRGASHEIHERQLVGSVLPVSLPRNQYRLVGGAPHYLFIAGGIGITPLLPMIRQLTERKQSWDLHYLGRSRSAMSFVGELSDYERRGAGKFNLIARDERPRAILSDILVATSQGTAVYCCGPNRLLAEVETISASNSGLYTLHVERFGRPVLANNPAAASSVVSPASASAAGEADEPCDPNSSFRVELKSTGKTMEVGAGESILECARKVRTGLSFSCSDGYCGTCETRVIAGVPDHRDSVLTDEEKAESRSMMICVGRSRTKLLVLDL
jgi:ferredoxin-NADP reductase